jgi:hypothetical protein
VSGKNQCPFSMPLNVNSIEVNEELEKFKSQCLPEELEFFQKLDAQLEKVNSFYKGNLREYVELHKLLWRTLNGSYWLYNYYQCNRNLRFGARITKLDWMRSLEAEKG